MEILKSLFYDYWKNAIILILLLFIGCGCSSRKVQKSSVKEDVKTEQTISENKDITKHIETNQVINNESNDFEITPIDTSKVVIINGKVYKNAKVKITNRKSQSAIFKKETVKDLSKKQTKVNNSSKKATKVKSTEKKPNIALPLFLILIIIAIYIIWKKKLI